MVSAPTGSRVPTYLTPCLAIAISLVPPLSVAGSSYSQPDCSAGNGARLLFTTNMVVGGLTLIVTAVTAVARVGLAHRVELVSHQETLAALPLTAFRSLT